MTTRPGRVGMRFSSNMVAGSPEEEPITDVRAVGARGFLIPLGM